MKKFMFMGLCMAIVLAACSIGEIQMPIGGVELKVDAVMGNEDVDKIVAEVEPAGMSEELVYYPFSASFEGTLIIPVGEQTISVKAYVQDQLVGEGSAVVTIQKNQVASVKIWVLDTTGPPVQEGGYGPIIRSFMVSANEVATGQTVDVAVDAIDPDGDVLEFIWLDDCNGTFVNPDAAATQWSTSTPGTCKIRVEVYSDGLMAHDGGDLIIFESTDTGAAEIEGEYVPNPEVYYLYVQGPYCYVEPDDINASCRHPIQAGQKIGVIADVSEGSQVQFSDDCGGQWGDGWRAPLVQDDRFCILTATATKDSMSASLSAGILVLGGTPPTNETCETAEVVSVSYENPTEVAGSTWMAQDDVFSFEPRQPAPDLVYQFTLQESAEVIIETLPCEDLFDTFLFLDDSCQQSTCLAFDDEGSPHGNNLSRIEMPLPAGTYYVVVDGYGSYYSSMGRFILSISAVPVECQDTCEADATECDLGQLRTCVSDELGCLDWTEWEPCLSGLCQDETACYTE